MFDVKFILLQAKMPLKRDHLEIVYKYILGIRMAIIDNLDRLIYIPVDRLNYQVYSADKLWVILARCWIAPDIPAATYSSGATTFPVWPTCKLLSANPLSTAAGDAPTAAFRESARGRRT
ncbi:Disintegrin and metalloproteinase domain-containing protein B [Fusarium oxysporum f. sp. albedinis]|nr:Disintegrin and metalloproteinase domain-containing protein B [Fusarium oxysporum f. sp. albedinis]